MAPLTPPTQRIFEARGRRLNYAGRTLVMGILNVTPDSFSDGGRSAVLDDALANAHRLVAEGADILDIGGESTRPGHTPVPAEEEMARVLPAVKALAALPVPISVDTQKAVVAAAALKAGASIVNDIWGLMGDPEMARVAAAHDAGVVAMHNRASVDPNVDIVADILGFFDQSLERAARAGIRPERISLDPGIGFGKTFEQNLKALASLEVFSRLGFPLLLGTSRKSLIGKVIEATPAERLPGTIASNVIGILAGCAIIRVHDVAAHVQAVRVTEAIRNAS
ncbi:dihydropteroate synthase [Ancylobacter dichloromethanicus]|uniref:Dihydropteroate synthase n=1 Tax=Ancylobacter dichloromethanicus TaxID=518825 RepID=A0A9W6N1I2_9HYPH|nr:dihydropteroate synthase [Ancylobacter dichloromethanicus]MBS7552491.1 dihydropteroate synthase [Ancylobacter dichloromethanicus]GLK74233.1 dihydropteroate synthase [Ancylobacter dichloromethanicus]